MLLREKDIKLTSYQQGDLQGIRQIMHCPELLMESPHNQGR